MPNPPNRPRKVKGRRAIRPRKAWAVIDSMTGRIRTDQIFDYYLSAYHVSRGWDKTSHGGHVVIPVLITAAPTRARGRGK